MLGASCLLYVSGILHVVAALCTVEEFLWEAVPPSRGPQAYGERFGEIQPRAHANIYDVFSGDFLLDVFILIVIYLVNCKRIEYLRFLSKFRAALYIQMCSS